MKQFGFQSTHSTEYAILQLSNGISNSLNEMQYTLGIFIDFLKAFDSVDHKILIEKWEKFGKKVKWVK